jgi:hypothetical protein
LARSDGEGRQHRVDVAVESRHQLGLLILAARRDRVDGDSGVGEGRSELVAPQVRLHSDEGPDACPDFLEHVLGSPPVGGAHREAGCSLAGEAGDPDHEELVEVRGEDRTELDALEERDVRIGGELEDARVEVEPRELAIEQPIARLRLRTGRSHAAAIISSPRTCVGFAFVNER